MKAANGLVWRYYFVWGSEHTRGEESGRKARPVCLQLLLDVPQAGRNPVLLVPLSSKPPLPGDEALEVPPLELRRVGLSGPSWLKFNDLNLDPDFERSANVAEARPLGQFSSAFTKRVRTQLRDAIARRRASVVARR
jgi:hypothetical protein